MVKVESVLRRIVLVHGAAHGAWCWEQLVPLLASRGYDVEVPDLPGLGDDPTSVKEVTLQSYIDRVVEVVSAQPEPVLLLGHSLGGGPISGAGETMPERIGRLVYLTAFLPKDSESLLSMIEIASRFPEPSVAREIRPPVDGAYEFPPRCGAADVLQCLSARRRRSRRGAATSTGGETARRRLAPFPQSLGFDAEDLHCLYAGSLPAGRRAALVVRACARSEDARYGYGSFAVLF